MVDDELDQEEVDIIDDKDDDTVEVFNVGPDSDEPEDVNEQDEAPVAKGIGKPVSELEEMPNIEAKQKEREALDRAMQEFLAKGGKIQTLESESK